MLARARLALRAAAPAARPALGGALHASAPLLKARKSKGAAEGAPADRSAALQMAVRQIESAFGKGAIMQLGQSDVVDVDVVSTGSLTLDLALGVGGLPRGRIVEIFGPESSGKTTMALHTVAEAQKLGGTCAFVDAEHALDPGYASALGVRLGDMYVAQPDSGEQALEIVDTLVRSGGVDVVVVDSVAALVPRAELEGEMGDSHIALQARLMSQALRKLTSSISRTRCMVLFINQIRHKVGVMFGSPEVTSGGKALPFFASVRMDIRRAGQIKQGTDVIGNETRVKVIKNKLAPPFAVAEFDMVYGKGVSRLGEVVDLGVRLGLVNKAGAWYSLPDGGQQLGQGRANTIAYLEEHPELAEEIEAGIRAAARPGHASESDDESGESDGSSDGLGGESGESGDSEGPGEDDHLP